MASDNHTTITGNLAADPELRFTNTGVPVASLRVAVTQRVQDRDGTWRDGETSFHTVNAWRDQAQNLTDSLGQGDRVMVTGRLRQRSWEPPRANAARPPRSTPTRSAPACASTPPSSNAPCSAAPPVSGPPAGRPSAASSTTNRRSEQQHC